MYILAADCVLCSMISCKGKICGTTVVKEIHMLLFVLHCLILGVSASPCAAPGAWVELKPGSWAGHRGVVPDEHDHARGA